MDFKDYYKILGISKTATQDEIKKAYRKLAMKFHPDTNQNNKAAEAKFKEANEANEVLGDPEKRAKYDKLGSSWNKYRQTGGTSQEFNWDDWMEQQNSGRRRKSSRSTSDFGDGFQGSGGVSDFFEKIFGEGFSQRQGYRSTPQRGEDFSANLEITLEEAFSGSTRIVETNGQKIEFKIKPGISNSQQLKISGKGSPGKKGGHNGDLLIKVSIQPHNSVERKNDDLYVEQTVDLFKAVLGATIKIATFGGIMQIKIPPETQTGKMLRLKGQGMPKYSKPGERGDLYVKILVDLPKNLTEREKELFEELRQIREAN